MSLIKRVRDLIGSRPVLRTGIDQVFPNLPTVDTRRTDYAYWDKARRGITIGMELSGLFIKPLGSKVAAWVLGQIPDWKLENEEAEDFVKNWWYRNHPKILRAFEESLNLGDSYLVVNSDLSLTLVPPHVVTPIYNKIDPSIQEGWQIREVYPVWGEYRNVVIIDRYTAKERVRIIEIDGVPQKNPVRYKNLIGRVQVIHIANLLGSDEKFGRPEGEALVNALQRYGDVIDAAIKGNIRQGRPTPVISEMGTPDQVDKFWEIYGETETRTLPDGTTEKVNSIGFNPDNLLTLSGTAKFYYASPEPFSGDTQNLLGLLFYLILQHTEIPEFAWGNAISASKASAESQLEPFVKWLEKKRAMSASWLTELVEVLLAYVAVLRPDIGEVEDTPIIQWPAITNEDAKVTLLSVSWAFKNQMLTKEEALSLVPLQIADPKTSVEKAEKEWEEIQAQLEAQDVSANASATGLEGQDDDDEQQTNSGEPAESASKD